ncbi:MAG: glucose-6-phosphate isomerase, partial [Alphaproteobacteria bacterium]
MPPPAPTPAWQALADHHRAAAGSHLRDLLGDDKRTEALTFALGGLCLDLSKNRLTPDTLALLIALADERGVAARRDAMAAGEAINATEDRAALHMALRGRAE